MRLLHQVRPREHLLAQGMYVGGAGSQEEWVWNEFPDRGQLLRVDAGKSLRELYFTEDGTLTRVDWLRITSSASSEDRLRCTVSYFQDSVHLGQQRAGAERDYREWEMPGGCCLRVPPARAALGKFVKEISAAGGSEAAFSLFEDARSLRGEIQRWRAEETAAQHWRLSMLSKEDGRERSWLLMLDEWDIPQRIEQVAEGCTWQLRNCVTRRGGG